MEWDVDAKLISHVGSYAGRPSVPGLTEIAGRRCHPDFPGEDPDLGCPAGWRHNPFTLSLDPYIRMRTNTGNRVSNPALDDCDDPFIWAAVTYYEREHERSIAHRLKIEAEYTASKLPNG